MPLVLILLGLMTIDTAARGTEHEFARQLGQDFGNTQFWSWAAAIAILGAIGYAPKLRKISDAAMLLVILVLVLKNGGLFAQAAKLITSPPTPAPSVPLSSYGSGSGSSSSGGGLGGLLGLGGGGSSSSSGTANTAFNLIPSIAGALRNA